MSQTERTQSEAEPTVNVIEVGSNDSEWKVHRTSEPAANAAKRHRKMKGDSVYMKRANVSKADLVELKGEEYAERVWTYWTGEVGLEVDE